MSQAFRLGQVELDALLAWLAPCREQAGEKYEAIRRDLLRFFASRRCGAVEEHVDDTIDRVARRVAGGEQIRSDPQWYFRGVAKKVFLESFKRRGRVCDLPPLLHDASAYLRDRTRGHTDCLRSLPDHSRELLEGYYLDDRVALAATLGITPNALRLRVFKEKKKLRAEIHRKYPAAKSPLGDDASDAR
jgi:DNA-directed RNA polymerase specialized sigma24 family protein